MMPQMESNDAGRSRPTYGGYTGEQSSNPPQYEAPYQQPQQPTQGGVYDDNFVEALAQRIAQRGAQEQAGKLYPPSQHRERLSPGQRLGLAIVSVVMLLPIGGALLDGGVQGTAGLIGFIVACAAIVSINVVFNREH